jgi:hypothetical protein
VRRERIGVPVQVAFDGVPLPPPRRPPGAGPFDELDVLERIPRRASCRHVLVLRPTVRSPVDLRLWDGAERYVPRRLRIHLPPPAAPGRVCRPALYPGAAYPVPAGAMGIRGRVTRRGAPMRWARVEARRAGGGAPVGVAHGDAHGEFVLLVGPAAAAPGAALTLPVPVRVTVFGPLLAPWAPAAVRDADPLWDLPLEPSALPPAGPGRLDPPHDPVLAGEARPAGYLPGISRVVALAPGGLQRVEFVFP